MGAMRGRLAQLNKQFALCSNFSRARWWKSQFRGIAGWHAAFVGVNQTIFRKLEPISNCGARRVTGLFGRSGSNEFLQHVKDLYRVDMQDFYLNCIVKYVGHCFRHQGHAISQLMSLPTERRLTELRLQGRRGQVSSSSWSIFLRLESLDLTVDPPTAGSLGVRGHSGYPIRWGEGWFGAVRDGGCGWGFRKDDKPEIIKRVNLLKALFKRNRAASTLPLQDLVLALQNGQNG